MKNEPMVKIDVPQSALVAAFIEKMSRDSNPFVDLPISRYAMHDDMLPAIGEAFEGGIYAGLTLRHNAPMALVLLPGDEELTWSKAGEWAKAQGGELPSRADALMLWQNVPKLFKETYYWTSEEHAGNADCAWIQYFTSGGQDDNHKSYGCRCRAVRRVAI